MDKLLIADDNPGVRKVLYQLLWEEDRDFVLAADGDAALRLARRELPDLVILDLRMPGRDGYDVCDALRSEEATRSIPVLMLTGAGDEEAARVAGADAYMAKPFDMRLLGARVRELLRRAS
jgi:two-component system, OmpR family, alkaline phosphatase synthesis response regulator PhoP